MGPWCLQMAVQKLSRAVGEGRIARTQLFVLVASWLWNQLASLENATPSGVSYPGERPRYFTRQVRSAGSNEEPSVSTLYSNLARFRY